MCYDLTNLGVAKGNMCVFIESRATAGSLWFGVDLSFNDLSGISLHLIDSLSALCFNRIVCLSFMSSFMSLLCRCWSKCRRKSFLKPFVVPAFEASFISIFKAFFTLMNEKKIAFWQDISHHKRRHGNWAASSAEEGYEMWLKASGNQVSATCDELFLGQTAVLRSKNQIKWHDSFCFWGVSPCFVMRIQYFLTSPKYSLNQTLPPTPLFQLLMRVNQLT